jgi:hypothetical protein
MPNKHPEHYETNNQPLHAICISSLYLKEAPYETIAHETAHFYNQHRGIKDTTKNQYHNKHFKQSAEKLLLRVEKSNKGFAHTEETEEFKTMLTEEFKPDKEAFKLFQNPREKKKAPNRNLLFMCPCGVKVRTARNGDKPFMATCGYCKGEFTEVEK